MNLASIAYKSIRQRALASSLTALSVALGVMLMVAVLVIFGIVDRTFSQHAVGYDLVVGPKGSDLQLVLNTIYRVDRPIENLPYLYYQEIRDDPRVKEAVPFALGDVTEKGAFPIVGTLPRYFGIEYAPGKKFRVRGNYMRNSFDAVIGSRVARENRWDIGSQFTIVHGGADSDHVHDEVFTVVGVLDHTGTPNDRTVFVQLDGFYMIEGHDKPIEEAIRRHREFFGEDPPEDDVRAAREHASHDHSDHDHLHDIPAFQKEVTAILLRMRRPPGTPDDAPTLSAPLFAAELKKGFKAQAVNPIIPMRRLMDDVLGNVRKGLIVMTALILIVSGVSIFVSIYNSMSDRRREIAIMRALGARRQTVFAIILLESILLVFGGGLLGLALGHGLVFAAAPVVEAQTGLLINPLAFEPLELVLFPALLVLASLIGFLPGMTAYRTDVARALAD